MKTNFLIFLCLIGLLTNFKTLSQQKINIIPQPQEVIVGKDKFTIDSQTKIVSIEESKTAAVLLQNFLQEGMDNRVEIVDSKKTVAGSITFKLDKDQSKEGYELEISKKGIEILASNTTGWFYGLQSLKQLFPVGFEFSAKKVEAVELPTVKIEDAPRFGWRAFMLDESRYFKGKEQVKMLLDEMALLKMNVFHWHLVDDQGWRIEIKKYPLLTEIGSKRKSTQVGALKWKSPIQSGEPHEGYYTQQEIKEIVEYASKRHITIVPEIEMPGHSSAAIAAYSWLGTNKEDIEVPIKFGVGPDVYDVSDPKVYQFLTDVLDEVMGLFPSKVIHIGGDEVKYNHWKSSESVQAYMKEKGLATPAELQVYFTNDISQYLQSKGRRMMGWNEIMGHNVHDFQDASDTESKQQLAQETVIHFWKGDVTLANQAASSGYDIVNSLHSSTYLDYDYKSIPLSKAYDFDPIPADLDPKYHNKVIGTGCQMWGEWIPTNGYMHFQVFPRIAAYAEVGWTEKKNKNYESFKLALKNLQTRWEQLGIYSAPESVVDKQD
ncbi:beta-N-acetylhexosaminidase [Reichenbachiella sp. MALMAid0571]|uniref:beta-N-acetylhexosaminidase n=1 Tax=Reichenbachiella sp. MALMAid0571 TaxID=3143939 RepID=UPI0032E040E8